MSSNFWLLSAAILAGCASAIDVINAENGSIQKEFAAFKSTFGITYADKNEENRRFAIFASNIAAAREASDANPLASFGITRFSDKSPSELSAHEQHSVADAEKNDYDSFSGLSRPAAANVSRVDWREKGAVTPVKDIGMCGGPYRYAVAANIESSWFISGHPLTPLSTQSFVSCARDPPLNCHTGDKKDIHKRILEDRKGVVTTEAAYPDDADKGTAKISPCRPNLDQMPVGAVLSSFRTHESVGEERMSEYVLNTGPMVVGFDSFPVYWYKKGIITDCKNRTSASMIGVIVGVDNEHRTPYWTIRMALGNEWGEDGYMRIAKGAVRHRWLGRDRQHPER